MKTEAQQQAVLAARTTGLANKRLAVLTAATDVADPATWVEATDVATTARPALAFNAAGVTNDDANNKAVVTWPAAQMEIDLPSGAAVVRLAICDGTGAIATAGKSISDVAFLVNVPTSGKLIIPANSQSSSEQ